MFNSVSCFAAAGIVAMLGPGSHQHENKSGRKVGDNHMGLNEITPYLVWIQRVKVGVGVLWYYCTPQYGTSTSATPPALVLANLAWEAADLCQGSGKDRAKTISHKHVSGRHGFKSYLRLFMCADLMQIEMLSLKLCYCTTHAVVTFSIKLPKNKLVLPSMSF